MIEPKYPYEIGMAKYAKNNDKYCGDLCAYWDTENITTLLIVDGLGHGEQAEHASRLVYNYVQKNIKKSLEEIFQGCDKSISTTRGAAMAIVKIDHILKKIDYIGVGNTQGVLYSQKKCKYLVNQWGIVGTGIPNLIRETYPIFSGDYIILFTDGIKTLFDPSQYQEKWNLLSAAEIAEDIGINWATKNDDVGVLVYQERA